MATKYLDISVVEVVDKLNFQIISTDVNLFSKTNSAPAFKK